MPLMRIPVRDPLDRALGWLPTTRRIVADPLCLATLSRVTAGTVVGSAILLALGAAIGFVPTFLLERSKQRHALRTRWDVPLYELCGQFLSVTRTLVHLAKHLDRSPDQDATARTLDARHAELRGLYEQLRLLGNRRVQETARVVIHHGYAVRAVAEGSTDMRAKDYPGLTPEARVKAAVKEFVVAVRGQLGVARADDVPDATVLPDEPWTSKWFST